jgi:endonuclease-3 related protein
MCVDSQALYAIYEALLNRYGPQHWWPAESVFEILVGAILTQNTAWTNVERAIDNLKSEGMLKAEAIVACPRDDLAALIRPAGYFNVKAARLQNFCRFMIESGGIQGMGHWSTPVLRARLLAVNGIGPETADAMILYGFQRPVFVIDAYTRRLGKRLGILDGDETYEQLSVGFASALPVQAPLCNEYHALIVRHAKEACTGRNPQCTRCCLRDICAYSDPDSRR